MAKVRKYPETIYHNGMFQSFYFLFKYLPSPLGDGLRGWLAKKFLKEIGDSVIAEGVTLAYPYGISIGENVKLNEGVYVSGYGEVEIGDNVRIGPKTIILSSDHGFEKRNVPIYLQQLKYEKVKIEKDVFIGCGAIILMGVTIGQGSIVGAGSVVTKNVPKNTIVAGVPAKKIRSRFKK